MRRIRFTAPVVLILGAILAVLSFVGYFLWSSRDSRYEYAYENLFWMGQDGNLRLHFNDSVETETRLVAAGVVRRPVPVLLRTSRESKEQAYRTWISHEDRKAGLGPWVPKKVCVMLYSWREQIPLALATEPVPHYKGLNPVKLVWPRSIEDSVRQGWYGPVRVALVEQTWAALAAGSEVWRAEQAKIDTLTRDAVTLSCSLRVRNVSREAQEFVPWFFLTDGDSVVLARMHVVSDAVRVPSGIMREQIAVVKVAPESTRALAIVSEFIEPTYFTGYSTLYVEDIAHGWRWEAKELPPLRSLLIRGRYPLQTK